MSRISRARSLADPIQPRATWARGDARGVWRVLVQSGPEPPIAGAIVWVEKRDRTHVAVRITRPLAVRGWGWLCEFETLTANPATYSDASAMAHAGQELDENLTGDNPIA
jgi:hypothetical protein